MKLTKVKLKEMVRKVVKESIQGPMDSKLDILKKSLKADLADFHLELKDLFDLEKELKLNDRDELYDPLQGILLDIEQSVSEMAEAIKKINQLRDNRSKGYFEESTGGMSSASMGGPIIGEADMESSAYHKGYGEALEKVSTQLDKLAAENSGAPIAVTLRNLSRQLQGFAAKSKAASFKAGNITEMFSAESETFFKVLDKASNKTGKQKLLYQWVKSGKISYEQYLELSSYIDKDLASL